MRQQWNFGSKATALNTEDAIMLRMKLRHHPKIISRAARLVGDCFAQRGLA